jgi:predicted PurR-regulated permease PerM
MFHSILDLDELLTRSLCSVVGGRQTHRGSAPKEVEMKLLERASPKKRAKHTKGATKPMVHPTPIRISKRTASLLALAVVAILMLVLWAVPSVLVSVVGGFGLALVLSFPVRTLSRLMPRGLAILISFLALFGLVLLAILILVPLLVVQGVALVGALPDIANNAQRFLLAGLELLDRNGLLPGTTDQAVASIGENLSGSAKDIAGSALGGAFGVVSGTFSFALSLFGVVFVAAYMLIDVRRFKTAYLLAFPAHYRRDARDLWNAFGLTLSRYLNGLALDLAIQGAISAVALYLIGVPYALVLGAFVSLTALIPYIGAWLGAVPAIIVAFTVSPTAVILTAIVFLAIQQLEGNFLMPKIQGQSLNVHPVLVFLAVIIGGGLAGLIGVLLAVPTLAVLRVLFDFFRARLRTVV